MPSGTPKNQLGNYELLIPPIGNGAEGRVYKARRLSPGTEEVGEGELVALKRLRQTGNEKQSELFVRSARILRSLNHPNIVRYKDSFIWGEDALDEEVYCLVTELLDGETLKDLIDRNPKGLPWETLERILTPTLRALEYADHKKVTHRDVKPSNIFITKDGTVKLIDFGVARHQGGDATNTGSTAGPQGTGHYMACDFLHQGENFHGDRQSDIFSFGVCFYQALTGQLPYPSQIAYYQRCMSADKAPRVAYPYRAFRILRGARSVIEKCLAFERGDRYQNFTELLKAFNKIQRQTLVHDKEQYEYLEYIGKGGFGRVFRAQRKSNSMDVAIKEVLADANPERFIHEAKVLKNNPHPNLVKYLDFVQINEEDLGEERRLFLILEYLKGMPQAGLRGRIKTAKSGMDPRETLRTFSFYLDCLEHLHKKGIIHRDIKPGNLYAPANAPERAKIFDLGIARDTEGAKTRGRVPGTLDYMPPEFATQETGRGSPESDIYSVGITLYECLTGATPLPPLSETEGKAWTEWYKRSEQPQEIPFTHPVFTRNPELKELLLRALAFRPKDRFRSAEMMRSEIRRILAAWERAEQQESYKKALVLAKAALDSGDFDEAEQDAKQALAVWKDCPEANNILIKVKEERRRKSDEQAFDDAMLHAEQALVQRDWTQAIQQVNRALCIRPRDSGARSLRDKAKRSKLESDAKLEEVERETAITVQLTNAPSEEGVTAKTMPVGQETARALGSSVPIEKLEPPPPPKLSAPKMEKPPRKEIKIDIGRVFKIAAAIILVLSAATGGFQGWKKMQIRAQAYDAAMSAGRNALDGKNYDETVADGNKALGIRPNDAPATELIHQAYQGMYDKDMSEADSAIRTANYGAAAKAFGGALDPAAHLEAPQQAAAEAGRKFAQGMSDAASDEKAGNEIAAFAAVTNAMSAGYSKSNSAITKAAELAVRIAKADQQNWTDEGLWIKTALKLDANCAPARDLSNEWVSAAPPPALELKTPSLEMRGDENKLQIAFGVSDKLLSADKLTLSFKIDPPGIAAYPSTATGDKPALLLERHEKNRETVNAKLVVTVSADRRQSSQTYDVTIDAWQPDVPALVLYGETTVNIDVNHNNPIRLACLARNRPGLAFDTSDAKLLPLSNIQFRPADANQGETNDSIILHPRLGYVGAVNVHLRADGGGDYLPTNNTIRLIVGGHPTPPRLECGRNEFVLEQDGATEVPVHASSDYFPAGDMTLSYSADNPDLVGLELNGEALKVQARRPGLAKITLSLTAPNGTTTSNDVKAHILPAEPPQITGLPAKKVISTTGQPGTPIQFTITDDSPPIHFEGKFMSGLLQQSDWKVDTKGQGSNITVALAVTPPEDLEGSDTFEAIVADAFGHRATHEALFQFMPPANILTNPIGMTFAWVRGLPGTEGTHWKGRSNGAWVSRYEVTQEDFNQILHVSPSVNNKGGRYPVENMSMQQAQHFCEQLTALDKNLPSGWHYSLPTEQQWEYFGADTPVDAQHAFFLHRDKGTQPVGQLLPNAFGLYDVLGNVAELTLTPFRYGSADDAKYFTRRGGGFKSVTNTLSPNPDDKIPWLFDPEQNGADTGFRVILIPGATR